MLLVALVQAETDDNHTLCSFVICGILLLSALWVRHQEIRAGLLLILLAGFDGGIFKKLIRDKSNVRAHKLD